MSDLGLEEAEIAIFYPSADFWVKWRRNKHAMKAKGYRVVKIEDNWFVLLQK